MTFDGHTKNCATALELVFPNNVVIKGAIAEFKQRPKADRFKFATTVDPVALAAWLAERFELSAVIPTSQTQAWGVVSIANTPVLAAFDRGITWVYGRNGLSSVRGATVLGAWRLP